MTNTFIRLTYLHPDHLCQRSDELGSRIDAKFEGLLVHHLAYRVPQGSFQSLQGLAVTTRYRRRARHLFQNLVFLASHDSDRHCFHGLKT